jgi:hypothetical protein
MANLVPGQIGVSYETGCPWIHVHDNVYGAKLPLTLYGLIAGTSPENGQAIITTALGLEADFELAIGYNGYWWHTNTVWTLEPGLTATNAGIISILPYTFTLTNLPALGVAETPTRCWWCKTGWYAE